MDVAQHPHRFDDLGIAQRTIRVLLRLDRAAIRRSQGLLRAALGQPRDPNLNASAE